MRRRVGKAALFAVVPQDFDSAERHRGTQPHITLPVPQLYHPSYLSTKHTLVPSTLCGRSLEVYKHPCVPECVGFDPLQVEKFCDSFIIGTEEFLVDPIGDGRALDRDKAVISDKSGLDCKAAHAEHTTYPIRCANIGDSINKGTEEFLVDPIGDWRALDRDKAVFSEKSGLECQAEHAAHTQFPRSVEKSGHEPAPDTETTHGGVHRHRAYLRKILPEDMESPAADHTVVAPVF